MLWHVQNHHTILCFDVDEKCGWHGPNIMEIKQVEGSGLCLLKQKRLKMKAEKMFLL